MEFVDDTKMGGVEGGAWAQRRGHNTLKGRAATRGTYIGYRYGLTGTSQISTRTNAKSFMWEGLNPCTGSYWATNLLCIS